MDVDDGVLMENEDNIETATQCALTTMDNPYDPLDDFDHWFLFDVSHGYNTCSYLARISHVSDSFPDKTNDSEIERAIDEILKYDFQGIYRKVKKGDKIVVVKEETNSESNNK